jgi:hypothetical protein
MLVRHVADAIYDPALFVERERLVDAVAIPLHVSVEIGNVIGNELTARVEPRTRANAIPRVHGRLTASRWLTEVGAPRASGRRFQSATLGHLRTVSIGSGDAAIVGAVTFTDTGDEERGWTRRATASATASATLTRRAAGGLLRRLGKRHKRSQCGKCCRRKNMSHPSHLDFLLFSGLPSSGARLRSPVLVLVLVQVFVLVLLRWEGG